MKRVNMKLTFHFCKWSSVITGCMLLLLTSCNGDNESPCGCNSDETTNIEDDFASVFMHNGKPTFISLEKGFLTLCDSLLEFDDGAILQNLSGKLKSKCTLTLDTVIRFTENYAFKSRFFELKNSKSFNLPLLNNPITWKHYKIEIIRSEDYGYPEGFGFNITNLNSGFKLNQAILPVGGFVPCKTEKDALKVAFLFVSKMYHFSNDFAGPHEWDLQFIGVLD
jgi:hypothetical protein